MPTVKSKKKMTCNRPEKSWKPAKKRVVKACSGGKEKIIHFGASGFGNNYSDLARKSFRARHKCDTANDKLTARYWSCKKLWSKGGSVTACPKSRTCKGVSRSRKRKSALVKSRRRSPRRSPRKSVKKSRKKRKSPLVKSRRRSLKKSKKRKSPLRKSRQKSSRK